MPSKYPSGHNHHANLYSTHRREPPTPDTSYKVPETAEEKRVRKKVELLNEVSVLEVKSKAAKMKWKAIKEKLKLLEEEKKQANKTCKDLKKSLRKVNETLLDFSKENYSDMKDSSDEE